MSTQSGPRHRVFANVYTDGAVVYNYTPKNQATQTFNYTYDGCNSDRYEMHDVLTEKYRTRKAAGEIINNPCTITRTTRVTTDGSYDFDNGQAGNANVTGDLSGSLFARWMGTVNHLDTPNYDANLHRAKLKALAAIDPSEFSFGEDIGEALLMTRNLKVSVPRLLKLMKKYDYGRKKILIQNLKPFALEKALANNWLKYRFLISPLVRSMENAVKAYQAETPPDPPRLTARGIVKEISMETDDSTPFTWLTSNVNTNIETEYRAYIIYEGISPPGLNRKLGIRVKDIPETAWQLLTLSFMVDRVVNISDSIRALTNLASPSLNILAGGVTVKETKSTTRSGTLTGSGIISRTGSPGSESLETESYTRTIWDPSALDAVPSWHPKELIDDAVKITDLFSLILSYALK